MIDLKQAKEMLVKDEGCALKPYRCTAGKLTIGVGHNIEDNGITQEMADYILNEDVKDVVISLERSVPVFDDLSPTRQLVLVNMVFNMGITRFLGFKKFLAALGTHDYKTAEAEMANSAWAKQLPERSSRLRRLILTGEK